MDRILIEERKYIVNLKKQIVATGCNVLLIQKSILRNAVNDLTIHFLTKKHYGNKRYYPRRHTFRRYSIHGVEGVLVLPPPVKYFLQRVSFLNIFKLTAKFVWQTVNKIVNVILCS